MNPWRHFLSVILAGVAATWASGSAACTVSTTPLVFGAVDPLAGMPTDSAGSFTVNCPEATSYVVAISGGNGPVHNRFMAGASDQLIYQLYTDAGLNYIWGDGTAGTNTVSGSTSPMQAEHTVYGRIPSQPLARAGQYTDVVIITVSY